MEFFNELDEKQKRNLCLAGILAVIITCLAGISDLISCEKIIRGFTRPEAYENSRAVDFTVEVPDDGRAFEYDGTIDAREPDEAGKEAYLEAALNYFESSFIREGESRGSIKSGINIPASVPQNPCTLKFSCDIPDAFRDNGNMDTSAIRKPVDTVLSLTAVYGEKMERTRKYAVRLEPDGSASKANLESDIKEVLSGMFADNVTSSAIRLPDSIGGSRVRFVKKSERMAPKIMLISLFAVAAAAFIYKDQNDQKKIKRKEDLKNAYAEFTGRFVILLGASLSVSDIMKRLADESAIETVLNKEIRVTVRQMDNGMTEREAFESFGRRCSVCGNYMKFSSILTESLRMGAGQILDRLMRESENALEERKNNAAENGGKADTKMLLPMMLQLILVMVMIMVPAFMMAQ